MNGSENVRRARCRQVVPRRDAVLLVLEWEAQPGLLEGTVYFRCRPCDATLNQTGKFHIRQLRAV